MRLPTFWVRYSVTPMYAQDCRSYILLGNHCHIFNSGYGVWFVTTPAPKDPNCLNRENSTIRRCSMKEWLRHVGARGKWEILEDLSGLRWAYIAKKLSRFRLFPKVWRESLLRFAMRDARQDFSLYERAAEPIRCHGTGCRALN